MECFGRSTAPGQKKAQKLHRCIHFSIMNWSNIPRQFLLKPLYEARSSLRLLTYSDLCNRNMPTLEQSRLTTSLLPRWQAEHRKSIWAGCGHSKKQPVNCD